MIDKKQPTLASCGFRKGTLHSGETVEVDIPKFATTDLGTYSALRAQKSSRIVKDFQYI